MTDTSEIVKGIIQTQVIAALNEGPQLIEALVKAALSKPVDRNGRQEGERDFDSYNRDKHTPFIDYMIADQVRMAARAAVIKVIAEKMPDIEGYVREGLSSESIVQAVTKALVGVAAQEWKIDVHFNAEERRR